MRNQSGGPGSAPPLKNHKKLGFLSSTGLDPLKNHKATKPEFNVWPSSARQRTPFKRSFAGGPMMAHLVWHLDPLSPSSTTKNPIKTVKMGPPLTKLSGSAHVHICSILRKVPRYPVVADFAFHTQQMVVRVVPVHSNKFCKSTRPRAMGSLVVWPQTLSLLMKGHKS